MRMNEDFVRKSKRVIEQCKTIPQLHQAHAHAITAGLVSLHPCLLLSGILRHALAILPTPCAVGRSYALCVFSLIPRPSAFSFNVLIHAETTLFSSPLSGVRFFASMRRLAVPPDSHTFPFALKAASRLRALPVARALHSQALRFGFCADLFLRNSLTHAYSVSGDVSSARRVFREASCKNIVSYNAMIDGFVKAGQTDAARQLFDEMPRRDGVSWATLLAGYAKMGQCQEAIQLFRLMLASSGDVVAHLDNVSLVAVLSACSQLGDLNQGKAIHEFIERNHIRIDAFLCTGLVNLYAKCGCIDTAREIFQACPDKTLFTWNAMIVGLGMHGCGSLCLDYFNQMVVAGVVPDGVTLLGVLVGCSHAGLVREARQLFEEMETVHGVPRELKHYGCMADLLGRAGLIEEAIAMVERVPAGGDVFVWGGLLNGCRLHGWVEVAERAAKHIMALSPEDGGVYSVMTDIYTNQGRWDDALRMRTCMSGRGWVKKGKGFSLVDVDGVAHEFLAGDSSHPRTDEIYFVLNGVGKHLIEAC